MEDESQLSLRDYVSVLRRRKWIVVVVAAQIAALAVVLTLLQTPTYRATARVLVQPRSSDTLFNPTTGQAFDQARAIQTELQVVESRPVQDKARDSLGTYEEVSATGVGQTNVIAISAVSTNARRAAEIANAYADAYVAVRRQQNVDDLLAAVTTIQAKISDLDRQIAATDPRDTGRRKALSDQQNAFKEKLDETQVASSLQTGGVRLVNAAETPTSPFSPAPVRNVVIALFLGTVIGVAVAFAFEYFDDSIKSSADLQRAIGDQPPIRALIPKLPRRRGNSDLGVISLTDPTSPSAEAYRSLRTNLQYLHLKKPPRIIQVTSPSEGEGKTTTVVNLGVALANAGQSVVLVCSDFRRPRLHEFFGMNNWAGFTSVILGEAPLSDAVQPAAGVPNLYILSSGPLQPNPSELLASQRTRDVLDVLRNASDVVLLDCPPILPVTDAAAVAHYVDATLVVARAGMTTGRELARAMELLQQVDAPIVGVVLNGAAEVGGYKHYRYEAYTPSENGQAGADAKEVVL